MTGTAIEEIWSRLTLSFGRNLPIVYQRQMAECWLACLAMVGNYHGAKHDLASLRQMFVVSNRGGSFRDIVSAAQVIGLNCRAVRVEIDHIGQLDLPAIIHWKFNHFVVLRSLTHKGAVIHDPAIGKIFVARADFARDFTGMALELWKAEKFSTAEGPQRLSWMKLLGRPAGLVSFATQLMMLGFVIQLLSLCTPVITQWTIDNVVSVGSTSMLATSVFVLALALLLRILFDIGRGWLVCHSTSMFSVRWRSTLVEHLFHLPIDYFGQRHAGTIASNFSATETIVRTANDSILNSLLDGVMTFVTLALMVQYSAVLTAVTLCGAVIYAVLRSCFGDTLQMRTQEQIAAQTAESAHFLESLRCIRTVKVLAREQVRHQEWLTTAVDAANAKAVVGKLQVLFKAAGSTIGVAEQTCVFWLAMSAVIGHNMTIGAVVAFLAFREQFYQRFSSVVETLVDVKLLRVHAERVSDIVLAKPDRGEPGAQQQRLGYLGGSITCVNVSFRYSQSGPHVLDGINLHVEEGEHIAITGTSGCGKSTLIALLLGLQHPVEGQVNVSGVPIGALGRDELRRHIVAVSQEDVLFSGSIMQNIASFDAEIDVEFAMSCAKLAQIDNDILRMPMGYNTIVGESGDGLSGGQKQRICLARALYRRPRVLIMDEATSNLDVPTERLIAAAIKELGMTRITIAHRPETIRSADKLYLLHQGTMSEANAVELLAVPARDAAPIQRAEA